MADWPPHVALLGRLGPLWEEICPDAHPACTWVWHPERAPPERELARAVGEAEQGERV